MKQLICWPARRFKLLNLLKQTERVKPMLALSTVWNAARRNTGRAVIQEIRETGARGVELNFFLDRAMAEEILTTCRKNSFPITSLHNFCPVPDGLERLKTLPDHYSLASLDENTRNEAVRYTKETILTASRCGASAVVLHCGRAEMKDRTRELIQLAQEEQSASSAYRKTFHDFFQERSAKSPAHVRQLIESLKKLSDFAVRHACLLGLENRFYFREIPFGEEFKTLFDALKGAPVGLWLDVGHNHILEKLGFIPRGEVLKNFGDRLIGIHLHNVHRLVDHQAAGDGDVDFNDFKPYVRSNTIKVMEFHGHVSVEKIKESMNIFQEVFGD